METISTPRPIGISVGLGIAKSAYQSSLQEEEKKLWEDFYAAQLEQSLRFKIWQHQTCLHWATVDIHNDLRRAYYRLWNAFDPDSGLKIIQNDSFRDIDGVTIDLTFEPQERHRLQIKLADKPCAQSGDAQCRIQAGKLEGIGRLYLPLDVNYAPPGE